MGATTEKDKGELLRKAGIFSTLGTEELAVIERFSEFRHFAVGSTVFEAGSVGEELFIVADGEVIIRRHIEEGNDIDLARYIPGDSFGEMDLLHDDPRSAGAIVECDTTLLVFPRSGVSFQSVLSEHTKISAHILYKFMTIVAGRIRSTNKLITENAPWVQELRKQVLGDKLTGLFNATYLKEEFARILSTNDGMTGLLMVKPDNFKHINDTYGHEVGDEALKTISATLRSAIRPEDKAVRYRGNELAVIMSDIDRDMMRKTAETLRLTMRAVDLSSAAGEPAGTLPLTVSVAFGTYPQDGANNDLLTERVHDLLYQARDNGGDRVVSA